MAAHCEAVAIASAGSARDGLCERRLGQGECGDNSNADHAGRVAELDYEMIDHALWRSSTCLRLWVALEP